MRGKSASEIRRKNFICTRHFRAEDYKHAQSRSLNQNAVPSLNLIRLMSVDHVLERPFQPKPVELPKSASSVEVMNPFQVAGYGFEELEEDLSESQQSITEELKDDLVQLPVPSKVDRGIEIPVLKKVKLLPRKFQFSRYKETLPNDQANQRKESHCEELESELNVKNDTILPELTEDEQYLCEYLEEPSKIKAFEGKKLCLLSPVPLEKHFPSPLQRDVLSLLSPAALRALLLIELYST